jgi:hypothetical protein
MGAAAGAVGRVGGLRARPGSRAATLAAATPQTRSILTSRSARLGGGRGRGFGLMINIIGAGGSGARDPAATLGPVFFGFALPDPELIRGSLQNRQALEPSRCLPYSHTP